MIEYVCTARIHLIFFALHLYFHSPRSSLLIDKKKEEEEDIRMSIRSTKQLF